MNTLGYFLLFYFAVKLISHGWSKDDTDSPTGRSGLFLYTDNATGVQYVGDLFGGLTPRLDASGKPYVKN